MNVEEVKQIVETIKTLNLNVDIHTLEVVVRDLKPIIWWLVIKDFLMDIVMVIGFTIAIYFITEAIKSYSQRNADNN